MPGEGGKEGGSPAPPLPPTGTARPGPHFALGRGAPATVAPGWGRGITGGGRRSRGRGEPARPGGCWQPREGVGEGESQLGRRGLNGRGSRGPGRLAGLPLWGEARGPLARLVPPAPACRPLQPIVPLGGLFWALAGLQSRHRVGRTGADDRRVPQGGVGQTEGAPPAACRAPPSTPSGAAGSGPRPHPRVPPHRPPPMPAPLGSPGKPDGKPQRRGGGGGATTSPSRPRPTKGPRAPGQLLPGPHPQLPRYQGPWAPEPTGAL